MHTFIHSCIHTHTHTHPQTHTGKPKTVFGNFVVDLNIFIPWALLDNGNMAEVAACIDAGVKEELDMLESDVERYSLCMYVP
jgi:hypothetical protein